MLCPGDSVWGLHLESIAQAATDAARAGTPLIEATYIAPRLEITGTRTLVGRDGSPGRLSDARVVAGEEIGITQPMDSDAGTHNIRSRVGRCAYVCASTATCPLFQTPETQ